MELSKSEAGSGTLDGVLLGVGSSVLMPGIASAINAARDLQAGSPALDILAGPGGAALGLLLVGGTMAAKAAHNLYVRWQSHRQFNGAAYNPAAQKSLIFH